MKTPLAVLALVGVHVLPMTEPERLLPDQTVLIRGDRILVIGPRATVQIPDGAIRVDGAGKYLLPGLADMHVHLEHSEDPSLLQLFLANGVTTVRSMDGRPYVLDWKKQVAAGKLPGPRIYSAGPLLDGDPPLRPDNTVVRDAAAARAAVLAQKAAGYDFIKVYTNLTAETYHAVLATARETGLPVAGHVPRPLSLREVLAAGHRSIEHLGDYDEVLEADDSPFRGRFHWSKRFLGFPADLAGARAFAAEQARAAVWSVPTLVQADKAAAPDETALAWLAAPEMQYIPAEAREFWRSIHERTVRRMDDDDWKLVAQGRANRLALLKVLHAAGVPLLIGTDTPNPFVLPGFSVVEELQNFVDAGVAPGHALRAATREAARFLGELSQWGTVEEGKVADLLLVDANPLEAVANVKNPAGVLVQGQWLAREDLQRMLAALR